MAEPMNSPTDPAVCARSGLSDAGSVGMPDALIHATMRVAFLDRTSTTDRHDPHLSTLAQLAACRAAIPESWVNVAPFYDTTAAHRSRFDVVMTSKDGGADDLAR